MNATGESTPGTASTPVSTEYVTGQLPNQTGPTPGLAALGAGVPDGVHRYWITFWMRTARRAWARRAGPVTAGPNASGQLQPFNQIPMTLPQAARAGASVARQAVPRHCVTAATPGPGRDHQQQHAEYYLDTTPTRRRGAAGDQHDRHDGAVGAGA